MQYPSKISRRQALKAMAGAGAALPALQAAIDNTEPIRITQIDAVTFRPDIQVGGNSGGRENAEFCWVRLHTDQGIIGTGETYPFHRGELGALRDYAQLVMRHDARDIDGLWRAYYHAMSMRNPGGADMRMLSAINMAQLDILGQAAGLPLYRLLGGRTRQRVRVYNTTTDYWAINGTKMGRDTAQIVDFLLERGITAMKIYPFSAPDQYLSNSALETGMSWIKQIRDRVGNKMDIAVDCWGRFDFPSGARIAKALEPYNIMYLEDAMLMSNARAYAKLARETSVPICMSETMATRYEWREFFELEAVDVVMYDLTWCGGVTEGKRISEMADTYLVPTSPHTCGGPLLYLCSIHLCTAIPNFLIMESNYWKYTHQFPYFLNNVPVPKDGHVVPTEMPGIGAEIKPELFRDGDAIVETMARR